MRKIKSRKISGKRFLAFFFPQNDSLNKEERVRQYIVFPAEKKMETESANCFKSMAKEFHKEKSNNRRSS